MEKEEKYGSVLPIIYNKTLLCDILIQSKEIKTLFLLYESDTP